MQLEIVSAMREVEAGGWDALGSPDDPFTEHAFLYALEESGSVGPRAGWHPAHVLARDDAGAVVGGAPLYIKEHSYGEYIFDWGWADAAMRAGIAYYPKVVCAVPYTPVTGPRLLVHPDAADPDAVRVALTGGVRHVADAVEASSVHVLFCTPAEQALLAERAGLLARLTHQFHWTNEGYESFDHWLEGFRSRDRKEARRERRLPPGVSVRVISGFEADDRVWAAVERYYRDTVDRKGGYAYLTSGFFSRLRTPELARRVLIFAAEHETDGLVSTALCFQRGQHLYGRYWGCEEGYGGLHFELCYHAPIELCIARGWTRFEAGAQGMHKLKRGLMPALTWSAHWLRDPRLADAVGRAVTQERALAQHQIDARASHGPFRRGT